MKKKGKGGKKKCLVLLVLAILLCSPVFADQTGTTFFHSHSYTDNVGAADKYSEYQKKQGMALGLGIDTVLYEFEDSVNKYGLESVNTEYKWDINNNNQSIYAVVHVNAWKAIKNFIK